MWGILTLLGFSRPWGPLRRGNGARPKRPDQTGQAHQTSSSSSGRSLRTAPAGGAGALYQSFQVGGPARQASERLLFFFKKKKKSAGAKTWISGLGTKNGLRGGKKTGRSKKQLRDSPQWRSQFVPRTPLRRFAASPRRRCVEASPFALSHNGTVMFFWRPLRGLAASSLRGSVAFRAFSQWNCHFFVPSGDVRRPKWGPPRILPNGIPNVCAAWEGCAFLTIFVGLFGQRRPPVAFGDFSPMACQISLHRASTPAKCI